MSVSLSTCCLLAHPYPVGNSNFYYAATLVFGLANGGALTDSIWAGLRIPFAGLEVGSVPEGKSFVGGGKEKGLNFEVIHI